MADDAILDIIGDPQKIDEELRDFRKTARYLSSRRSRITERYPEQWVALHSGKVQAHGPTLTGVLEEIDAKGLSRGQTIVTFIHKEPRTLIL